MILSPTPENLQNAIALLRQGHLVGLPTETVYGLGGDATQDMAVAQIFATKNRPDFNPLIIHGFSADSFKEHVIWTDQAEILANAFWPGPLTLILPKQRTAPFSLLASAGLPSIALRVPHHPVAQALLRDFGGFLAAPSANKSGRTSPTLSHHVAEDFPDLFILEGGPSPIGIESTIVDLSEGSPTLLRPGGIGREEIETLIGPLAIPSSQTIKSPGLLKSHYAPRLSLRLNVTHPQEGEAYLAFGPLSSQGNHVLNLSETADLCEAAANFFRMLRLLDQPSFSGIAVAPIPFYGLGLALNDRLERAAAPREF